MKVKLSERIQDCLNYYSEAGLVALDQSIQKSDDIVKGTLELLCTRIEDMKKFPKKIEIKENELKNLKTGTKLEVHWNIDIVSLKETYTGFFYNDEQKIIYDDDKYDSCVVISDSIHRNQCKVYAILQYGEIKGDIMK